MDPEFPYSAVSEYRSCRYQLKLGDVPPQEEVTLVQKGKWKITKIKTEEVNPELPNLSRGGKISLAKPNSKVEMVITATSSIKACLEKLGFNVTVPLILDKAQKTSIKKGNSSSCRHA